MSSEPVSLSSVNQSGSIRVGQSWLELVNQSWSELVRIVGQSESLSAYFKGPKKHRRLAGELCHHVELSTTLLVTEVVGVEPTRDKVEACGSVH